MKKIISIMSFTIVIVFLSIITVSAEEQPLKNTSIDPELGEILANAFDSKEREELQNNESYHDNAQELEISDQPILKVYNYPVWRYNYLPFDQLVDLADSMIKSGEVNGCHYVIFDKDPVMIAYSHMGGIYEKSAKTIWIHTPPFFPNNFIKDIQNMKATTEILGQTCKISNMVVFDGDNTDTGGDILCIDTDKGVFIKYYRDDIVEGTWFKEDDFRTLLKAWIEKESWIKSGYTYGSEASLSTFIENYADRIDELPPLSSEVPKKVPMYVWIIVASGVIVLCAAVVMFIFRKKIFISKYRR